MTERVRLIFRQKETLGSKKINYRAIGITIHLNSIQDY